MPKAKGWSESSSGSSRDGQFKCKECSPPSSWDTYRKLSYHRENQHRMKFDFEVNGQSAYQIQLHLLPAQSEGLTRVSAARPPFLRQLSSQLEMPSTTSSAAQGAPDAGVTSTASRSTSARSACRRPRR